MSQTALAVITQELKGAGVMAKISASLGKPATDPMVMKFIHGAIMEIEARIGGNSDITLCTRQSIIDSLIKAATVKLPVDSRQLAYLVPFGKTCTFMPSYKGYIYKVKEADTTMEITVGIVYKDDVFTCQETDNTATYEHKPSNPFEDNPKNITGAYCYMKSSTGSWIYRMSNAELLKVKAQSKMKSGIIWNTWELEQFKKSIVRRAFKMKFIEAISELDALDNKLFYDRAPKVAPSLADTAPLPEITDAEVIKEEKKEPQPELTQEELDSKAAKAKEAYHQEPEPKKDAPAKPQEPAPGNKVAAGLISYANPMNAGGYQSFVLEGIQDSAGKDCAFSTKDKTVIGILSEALKAEKKVSIEFAESQWEKNGKSGWNYAILSVVVL